MARKQKSSQQTEQTEQTELVSTQVSTLVAAPTPSTVEVAVTSEVVNQGDDIDEVVEEFDESGLSKRKKRDLLNVKQSQDLLSEIELTFSEINSLQRKMVTLIKQFKSAYQRDIKNVRGRKSTGQKGSSRATSGFVSKKPVPKAFKEFYNSSLKELKPEFNPNEDQPRTTLTGLIYDYIRHNSLYLKKSDGSFDKRVIVPDAALRSLFNTGDQITFESFQSHLSNIYANDEVNAPVSTPVTEPVVLEPVVEKKKEKVARR